MKPNSQGIWQWFDKDGIARLVEVYNVGNDKRPHFRVFFWGGYYNINDEHLSLVDTQGKDCGKFTFKAEWPDRWGDRVGDIQNSPNEMIYLKPSEEEMKNLNQQLDEVKLDFLYQ